MIVTKEQYEMMIKFIHVALKEHRSITIYDAFSLHTSYETLSSLFRQLFVRTLKRELRLFTNAIKQDVIRRVHNGESLLEISHEYQLGTYKFAMLYLQEVMGRDVQISTFLQDPEMIVDKRIRSEILKMIALDPSSAPEVDLLKEVSGKEYEDLLVQLLKEKKMCFETEVELRSKGKPKTPDILFLLPMAVELTERERSKQSDLSSSGSHAVVNWMDSKAMFADQETFEEQLDQFRAYNHRYGRGLVIYWHGFVEGLEEVVEEDLVLLRSSFPANWLFPNGDPADGREPSFDHIILPS